jgi:ATP-dependent DNA helicase RecQ
MTALIPTASTLEIVDVVRRYWGYDRLRPLQEEAIRAGLERRDSLVVLPTGGGKSLCYQVPPLLAERMDVVVSPLISLMKDQTDALRTCGYPAAALHSGMTPAERRQAHRLIDSGQCRLVLVSPERLVTDGFLALIENRGVRAFSVDEAHCISHWGHDFRPEYRRLAVLRERFPDAGIHAYTATATEQVRRDIIEQLGLRDPLVLVGRFDRPNLVYRVVPRHDRRTQVLDVVGRHPNEAVIVYCITRNDTEALAGHLTARGLRAAYYHAGLGPDERRAIQERFSREEFDVIVATVAFGMGIDRSNVRCVIHAGMPKSIEHYQQETGRAGRDGLEAECVLLYSPGDFLKWESVLLKTDREEFSEIDTAEASRRLLDEMRRYCSPSECRHKRLSEYFGQPYEKGNCGACDICLDECDEMVDGTLTAQKILSCVARVDQRFGVTHVAEVLHGSENQRILDFRHHQLSTYGLLKDISSRVIVNFIHQLVDQGLLTRTPGDRPILQLNDASRRVLRGDRRVRLVPPPARAVRSTRAAADSWSGVDRGLFESLRRLRLNLAQKRGVPPYVIFGDASLRDMARQRPKTRGDFLRIHGVGERKLADFGDLFLEAIRRHGD